MGLEFGYNRLVLGSGEGRGTLMDSDADGPFSSQPLGADSLAVICPSCRTPQSIPVSLVGQQVQCGTCGSQFSVAAPVSATPFNPYISDPTLAAPEEIRRFTDKKIAAGICGLLLGGLGVHKFILGFSNAGTIMLVVTLVGSITGACLLFPLVAPMAMGVIGFIEGIIYLTMGDEEFYRTYGIEGKEWF